ncbi:MAG: helix-hairpin-helix domain-containing protein [Candidatus Zixiibacteriota bacterium]|nr:MAG: helix-hairpin-helix domain-containing protein [candidate division Zixibacteria bacterium]
MASVNRHFEFTSRQLKFLVVLATCATIMGGYLLVKSYAYRTERSVDYPVFLSDEDRKFTGVFQLDPNHAPADSLELMPGIGRVLADRIVAYRQHSRFKTEIDITNVNGIGPKKFEQIRPYLRIRP